MSHLVNIRLGIKRLLKLEQQHLWSHCVLSLDKASYLLLSIGSTLEDRQLSQHK